jgi:hypothetical protein
MNIAFALDYIPRRMLELGYGFNYTTRYRHFLVTKLATVNMRAFNQFMVLITPENNIRVVSSRGVYDAEDTNVNFQQHEHSGKISIKNKGNLDFLVVMIQVIPLNRKKKNSHV